MKIKQLFNDDRAVSPVIGVILMVAITVILAAVIGTFVLGLGDQVQQTTPSVSIGFDYTDAGGDSLVVTHETGAELTASQVSVVVSGASESTDTTDDLNSAHDWNNGDLSGGDPVSAGSSVNLSDDTIGTVGDYDLDLSSATVRVTWTSETGEQSATLAEWSGPDA